MKTAEKIKHLMRAQRITARFAVVINLMIPGEILLIFWLVHEGLGQ